MCLVGDPNGGSAITDARTDPWGTWTYQDHTEGGTVEATMETIKAGGWDGTDYITGTKHVSFKGGSNRYLRQGPTCGLIREPLTDHFVQHNVDNVHESGPAFRRGVIGPAAWNKSVEVCVKEKIRGVLYSASSKSDSPQTGWAESLVRNAQPPSTSKLCHWTCDSPSCHHQDPADDDAVLLSSQGTSAFQMQPLVIADLRGKQLNYSILVPVPP